MLVALLQLFTGASLAPDYAGFGQASWFVVVAVVLVGVAVRGVLLARTVVGAELIQANPTKQEP